MEIVKFVNGKYAVRKGGWFGGYTYAAPDKNEARGFYWWCETVKNKAWVDTLEEAQARLTILQDVGSTIDLGTPV